MRGGTGSEGIGDVERATWAFVGLGVALRVARYAMDFPLWWDEAFLAVNFLKRGYLDLLRPLDYGQVCPLLFLWAELTVVKVLGFSEWSLRLVPMACAVGSVFLFRHAAGRVLEGVPKLLAVAIFAAAFHPIRHAADVKPYASDLLMALAMTAMALEWLRARERTAWLWAMAGSGPVALGMSHPAVFVAGGLGLALAGPAWRAGRGARLAWSAFNLATAGTFAALFLIFTRAQAAATISAMGADWAGAFPPVGSPWRMPWWLLRTHSGAMLAYPCGGPHGASILTLLLVVFGAVALWRSGERPPLAAVLAPLGVAMVAAALRRYPYGGSARFMQYAAPAVCLLAGAGSSVALAAIGRRGLRARALRAGVVALAATGVVPLALEASHPYRSVHARESREFARRFWPELERGGEVACLRWDFGVGEWDSIRLGIPVALCNQAIYSPSRRRGGPRPGEASATRPLRCVLCDAPAEEGPEVASWLEAMGARFELRGRRTLVVDMAGPGARPRPERYEVFEFVPKAGPRDVAVGDQGPCMMERHDVNGKHRSGRFTQGLGKSAFTEL